MKPVFRKIPPLCIAILFFAACASKQPLVTIGPQKGETEIKMAAGNYKFEPNNIKAYKGDVILFQIENTSNTAHDFTIKNPSGNILQSVDLPPMQTVTVKTELSDTGTYEFYCDKPFHSTLGMKGRIEVIQ